LTNRTRLIGIVARQSAILKLIRYQDIAGVPKIEEILRDADDRIRKLPVVQEILSKKRLPPPGSLSGISSGLPVGSLGGVDAVRSGKGPKQTRSEAKNEVELTELVFWLVIY